MPHATRTSATLLCLFLAGLSAELGCRDHATDNACGPGDAPQCDGTEISYCEYGQWKSLECATKCLQEYGTVALGCGQDPDLGEDACVCAAPDGPPDSNDGPCVYDDDPCDVNGDCCGFADAASYCVDDDLGGHCRATCYSDDDCSTGCCRQLNNGESACAPADACDAGCTEPTSVCDANGECCGYDDGTAYCVTFSGDSYATCAVTCFDGSDCPTGCCVDLDGGGSVCSPHYSCASVPDAPAAVPALPSAAMRWRGR